MDASQAHNEGNHRPGCTCGWHRRRHGEARKTAEYLAWQNMRARCNRPTHPSYKDYGGRGIAVCKRWDSYANFLADMGRRPGPGYSIERIDNDGPYSPENCRWATPDEQRRNQRTTRLVTFGGKTQCVTDWSAETGLKVDTIIGRLQRGWPLERVLTEPPQRGRW